MVAKLDQRLEIRIRYNYTFVVTLRNKSLNLMQLSSTFEPWRDVLTCCGLWRTRKTYSDVPRPHTALHLDWYFTTYLSFNLTISQDFRMLWANCTPAIVPKIIAAKLRTLVPSITGAHQTLIVCGENTDNILYETFRIIAKIKNIAGFMYSFKHTYIHNM